MNQDSVKKIEQASRLLDEVHQDLKDYMNTLPAEVRGFETVRVEVIIEPRFRDGSYTEIAELEIPAGLTGEARENAITEAASTDVVNEQCPWGAQEIEES